MQWRPVWEKFSGLIRVTIPSTRKAGAVMGNQIRWQWAVAIAAAAAVSVALAQQRDDPAKPGDKVRSDPATRTLTGKLVDLHQYMTQDQTRPSPRGADDPRRPGPNDRRPAKDPTDRGDDTTDALKRDSYRIFALETATGLVILNCDHHPGIYAVPRSDDDKPGADRPKPALPGVDNPGDDAKASAEKAAAMIGQDIRVTGWLYTKRGVQYLTVSSFESKPKAGTGDDKTDDQRQPKTPQP